jgi:hypothetical protein
VRTYVHNGVGSTSVAAGSVRVLTSQRKPPRAAAAAASTTIHPRRSCLHGLIRPRHGTEDDDEFVLGFPPASTLIGVAR